MEYDEFVREVQHRACLPSRGDGVRAIQATFKTLAERLHPRQPSDLAAELPPELGTFLIHGETTERFSVDDFFLRVAAKETADLADAVHHGRTLIDVQWERVSRHEMHDVCSGPTADYTRLFEAGSEGKMDINI